jgi:hypothetical protein
MSTRDVPAPGDEADGLARHLGAPIEELWPREDYQLTHTLLFPHGVFHIENLGGPARRDSEPSRLARGVPVSVQGRRGR